MAFPADKDTVPDISDSRTGTEIDEKSLSDEKTIDATGRTMTISQSSLNEEIGDRQFCSSEKDIEKAAEGKTLEADPANNEASTDANIVWWDGEDDPANPLNWPSSKKWIHVGIISLITFVVPLASSMFAPGVTQVMEEFDNTSDLLAALVVSIYVLGLGAGPLVIAPLSEVYGRLICYTICNFLYVVFTIACAVSTNLPMLIVFRLLAGTTGSSPIAIGGGTIADLFEVQERGVAIAFYTLGPVLGPAVGPVIGGFLTQAKGWRWIFWILSIMSGAIILVQVIVLRETYAVTLLKWKTKRLQKETGNKELRSRLDTGVSKAEILKRAIVRPTKMLIFSVISMYLAVSAAFLYGIYYLLLTTFPLVFEEAYGFSTGISGLTYIGLGLGNVIAVIIFTFTSDRNIKKRQEAGKKVRPEDRLPMLVMSGPVVAAGLFWYGWAAEAHTHWIVPLIGSSLVGLGNMLFFLPIMGYLVDAFNMYAASALAANTVLRSLGGALLPLAGRNMYETLGFGWGNSLLAFLVLAFSPVLFLLYKYGEAIRLKYPLEL